MDDVIPMTILESAPDLPGKLSRHTFSQSSVADDKIEHLSTIDILKDHVVVVLMDNHLTHAAYIGMVEK